MKDLLLLYSKREQVALLALSVGVGLELFAAAILLNRFLRLPIDDSWLIPLTVTGMVIAVFPVFFMGWREYWRLIWSPLRANGFYCETCGTFHEHIPLDYGSPLPYAYFTVPEEERAERIQITPDTCVIDNQDYLIRGCLYIPIHHNKEPFCWGVWVSLSEENFRRYEQIGNQDVAETEPPYFGWFCTSLPLYPQTLMLKTHVYLNKPGLRPIIELEPTDHPLAIEQREGISMARWHEIVQALKA